MCLSRNLKIIVMALQIQMTTELKKCIMNHTSELDVADVCRDTGVGEYPKDLKFFGWHPQCRCTTVPLLKTWEEMERDNDLIWQGKEPGPAADEVKEIPKQFQDWIINNREQIHRAKNKPYFIKFNMDVIGSLLK
jgi:hypothetical protein